MASRVLRQELLDSAPPEETSRTLRDLARLNRMMGGPRVVRSLVARTAPPGRFTLLDIGAASGDNGRAIRMAFPHAIVTSLDRRALHLAEAAAPRVAADAFHLPFRDRSFDLVLCSLFLHHFTDEQVTRLLARFYAVARRAVIAIDLYRHPLAYHFLPATRWLFRWQWLMLHDGPISVAASFRPRELARLARAAGISRADVRAHWPWFRVSLVARK